MWVSGMDFFDLEDPELEQEPLHRCTYQNCGRTFEKSSGLGRHRLTHAKIRDPEEEDQGDPRPANFKTKITLELRQLEATVPRIFPSIQCKPEPLPHKPLVDMQAEVSKNPAFPFSSVAEKKIADFAKQTGLTGPEVINLLKLMGEIGVEGVSVKSLPDIDATIKKAFPEELESYELNPDFTELEEQETYLFHYKQAWNAIKRIFHNPKYKGKLITKYEKKVDTNGKRVYGSLHNGLWWQHQQAQVKDGVVVPVIFYSDETTATSFRGRKFYPLYVTIGNLPKEFRRSAESYELLGYIPTLVGTEEELEAWSKVGLKSRIFHKCLELVTKSLIEPATSGEIIGDAEGKLHRAHPLFCYYIADWPEGKRVSLTRDGVLTRLPCHSCGVGNDELHLLSDTIRKRPIRDLEEMKAIVKEAAGLMEVHGKKTEGRTLAKQNSMHVYQNAFWGLPGTVIYLQIAPDLLHQFFLGQIKA